MTFKATLVTILIASFLFTMTACKGKKAADNQEPSTSAATENAATTKPAAGTANEPKKYTVVFTPDSLILGKKSEAFIKCIGGDAVELQDADGKSTGIQIDFKLRLTNKNHIGGGSNIHVDYTDARLQLDNGTSVVCDKGTDFLRAEPEASKEETWTFK